MDRDVVTRVSRTALGISVLAAAGGGLVAGFPGALGVLAGALISVASFRWLAWGAERAGALFAGGRAHPLWVLGLGLRYLVLFGLIALMLRAGPCRLTVSGPTVSILAGGYSPWETSSRPPCSWDS